MKPLPEASMTFKPLFDMLNGAIPARLLQAGLALGIFDALERYHRADHVAESMGAHAQNTRYLLDALVTIGLVEKQNGHYRNSALAKAYLTSGSDCYLGPLFRMVQSMSIDPLDTIETLVRSGPRSFDAGEEFTSPEDTWAEGARAGAGWAMGEMGTRAARIVSRLPGFAGFEKMLDLGGGHGLFALYMVRKSDILRAVVFDRAPVLTVASALIDQYEMDDRVTVVPGDYMQDDFGDAYDLVWASAALSFAKDHLVDLVKKIYAALNPDGWFISLHDGMTHEQTLPATHLGWLGTLLSHGLDVRFEQGEIAETMLQCGFRSVRSITVDTPMGVLDLDMARK